MCIAKCCQSSSSYTRFTGSSIMEWRHVAYKALGTITSTTYVQRHVLYSGNIRYKVLSTHLWFLRNLLIPITHVEWASRMHIRECKYQLCVSVMRTAIKLERTWYLHVAFTFTENVRWLVHSNWQFMDMEYINIHSKVFYINTPRQIVLVIHNGPERCFLLTGI